MSFTTWALKSGVSRPSLRASFEAVTRGWFSMRRVRQGVVSHISSIVRSNSAHERSFGLP
jgi:hypothetical protein